MKTIDATIAKPQQTIATPLATIRASIDNPYEMTDKKKAIGFFGIGMFIYLCISGLSNLLEGFVQDILILFGVAPNLTLWITVFFYVIIFIMLVYFVIKRISKHYEFITNNIVKYLVLSFVIYMIIQIMQIVYPSIKYSVTSELYSNNEVEYLKYLKDNYALYYIKALIYYSAMISTFILIYLELKNGSQQRV